MKITKFQDPIPCDRCQNLSTHWVDIDPGDLETLGQCYEIPCGHSWDMDTPALAPELMALALLMADP